MMLSLTGDGLN